MKTQTSSEKDVNVREKIQQLLAYNLHLTIHPSYVKKFLPEPLQNFLDFQNSRLKTKIATYLSQKNKVEPISKELLQHPYLCFTSFTLSQWQQLSSLLGALYFLADIKKTVHHFEKQILHSLLADKCYEFVIHRGNLYAPMLQLISVPFCEGELEQKVRTAGKFLLEYLWTQQSKPLLQRFFLQLPSNKTWNFQHVIDPQLQHQLFNICKHLQKKMEGMAVC